MTIFDVEKLPWAPSRGQASGVQSHLLLKTLKIRPRIQMLKRHLSEAWHLSQSEAARPPQPADATRSSVKECVLPSVPERVRLHPSLRPVIQQQGQAVDPKEMVDELKIPMPDTRLFLFWPLFLMTHLLLAATHIPSELVHFPLGIGDGQR